MRLGGSLGRCHCQSSSHFSSVCRSKRGARHRVTAGLHLLDEDREGHEKNGGRPSTGKSCLEAASTSDGKEITRKLLGSALLRRQNLLPWHPRAEAEIHVAA